MVKAMDKEVCRVFTQQSLSNELDKILFYYMQVYDEYYSTGSRDSAFLKDLVDGIIGISACLEVYIEQKGIHPNYAIEKLESSKKYINACIEFYKSKLEEENQENE